MPYNYGNTPMDAEECRGIYPNEAFRLRARFIRMRDRYAAKPSERINKRFVSHRIRKCGFS
jgi:hypothetical protein